MWSRMVQGRGHSCDGGVITNDRKSHHKTSCFLSFLEREKFEKQGPRRRKRREVLPIPQWSAIGEVKMSKIDCFSFHFSTEHSVSLLFPCVCVLWGCVFEHGQLQPKNKCLLWGETKAAVARGSERRPTTVRHELEAECSEGTGWGKTRHEVSDTIPETQRR